MWVTNARSAALSIITGGGKWIEITIPADSLYQHFLITAERRFWRCVQTGETPPDPMASNRRRRGWRRSGSSIWLGPTHGLSSRASSAQPARRSSTMSALSVSSRS
jgi:hypothetical protein